MTPLLALAIAAGAAVGAPLRFVVERRLASSWPWGTWLVNVAGSAVLGGLLGGLSGGEGPSSAATLVALVGTGFCGSLTTFGGFAAQVLDLAAAPREASPSGRSTRAVGYALVSVLVCIGVAGLSYAVAVTFTG